MKGIILAAGRGASLYPATVPVCKPLITVYDKPLIYYPLTTLITAGITDILIITPPGEMEPFVRLFGDGEELGIRISYKEQKVQRGIADAFRVGRRFIGDDSVCLALGDNIFYHPDMERILKEARGDETGASVFAYFVDDPRPYGVVELDVGEVPVSLEEKPKRPRSNYIVPGLYFYDLDRDLDVALTYKSPLGDDRIESHLLFQSRLCLVGRVGELKGVGKEASVQDLSRFPLALPSKGLQARDTLEDVLFAQNVNLDIRLEINSVRSLLDLVGSSPLVTILSEEAIHQVQGFEAVPIGHPDGRMDGCYHYLKGSYHKNAAQKFVEFLKENNSFNQTFG